MFEVFESTSLNLVLKGRAENEESFSDKLVEKHHCNQCGISTIMRAIALLSGSSIN